MSDVIVED